MSKSKKHTPVKENAELHFGNFLTALGFDWKNDPHMKDTPKRVSKMYVDELFKGLTDEPPVVTRFKEDDGEPISSLQNMVVGPIKVKSFCSHHFMPIEGEAWLGLFVRLDDLPGLSKYSKIVHHFARRPQVQERLTKQIADYLVTNVKLPNVAVMIKAKHFCTCHRGINEDTNMITLDLRGDYTKPGLKQEFLSMVQLK
jgi:GTP cyclohydrolase I